MPVLGKAEGSPLTSGRAGPGDHAEERTYEEREGVGHAPARVHTTAPKEAGRSGIATAERGKYTRDVFFWWWCRGGHISCCPLQCHPVLQCCNFSSDMDDRPKGLLINYEYESLNLHTSLS
jgi:hypothetical protein